MVASDAMEYRHEPYQARTSGPTTGLALPMPHFPKPFLKKSHQSWYVQLDGKQLRLGPDEAAAHRPS